ncbi:hypothetical protein COB55_03520 [Candidatus Wolfebacteria bacterium]|nr:MAG: hypothetical protein COB55_03520 [Candidatus Wolfebacteria bacterium]
MKKVISISESRLKQIIESRLRRHLITEGNNAIEIKQELGTKHIIKTMWQIEEQYKKKGWLPKGLQLTFFCPVYMPGEIQVTQLLKKRDSNDELILFPLPVISDQSRIKTGLDYMEQKLQITNPKKYLKDGELPTYSSLPGIEGVGSDHFYDFIAYEAVQLGCFSIVPSHQVNTGDPYNESYRFPGESGYSPFWRIPPFEEFQKMRPDLSKMFKKTDEGIIKVKFPKM